MKRGYSIAMIACAALAALSLTLQVLTVLWLLRTRQVTLAMIEETRAAVMGIGSETVSTTVQIRQDIPVVTSIPFYKEIRVPVNTVIPVDTTVIVPIRVGLLGTYEVEVPIRAVIPVDLTIIVPISETLDIVANAPLRTSLPVEVRIADTPLVRHLGNLDAALARAGARLERVWNLEE